MATTYSYSKNTDPTKAKYGESSSGVLALQQSLNKKFSGQTGYTPLKEDSKYGPLTQAASQFQLPSDQTQTSTSIPSEYYSRTSDRSKQLKGLQDIVTSPGKAPSLESTRRDLLSNSQSIIDAITAQYANTIAEERVQGDILNKRQRGVNVAAGLTGSDFASSAAAEVEGQTQKVIKSIEAERDAKINATLNDIAFRSQDVFQAQQDKYRQNAEDSIKKFDEFRQSALEDVSTFSQSGLTADQLRKNSPETWRQLLDQTGYSDAGLQAAFVASKPEPDFKEKVGDSIVYGYRDPQTGKITTEKVELPSGYSDFKTIDGEPYFINVEKGILTKASGYNKSSDTSSDSKKYVSGSLVTTTAKLSEGEQKLDTSRGEDGYVDPSIYKGLYDDWISSGGILKDFLSKFPPKNYVNPENKILPSFLRSPVKATKETVTGPFK